jgi:acetyl esterase/lipase
LLEQNARQAQDETRMPLDPHVQRLLGMLAATGGDSQATGDIAERRRSYALLMELTRPRAISLCATQDIVIPSSLGGVPLRVYTPSSIGPGNSPALLYLHGGGWVAGDVETHDSVCHSLAAASECRVISVDYRLAPEHRHPAALVDAEIATRWALDQAEALAIDPTRLAISGDSAGANLAAALCQIFRQKGEAPFALQLLLCPFLDLAADTASRRAYGQGYFMDLEPMRRDLELCLAESAALTDLNLSPLRAADFAGLPMAQIHTAEFDPMRDEGEDYAARLNAAGVVAHHVRHPGMIHQFYAMGGVIPYASTAMREIGAAAGAALRAHG